MIEKGGICFTTMQKVYLDNRKKKHICSQVLKTFSVGFVATFDTLLGLNIWFRV